MLCYTILYLLIQSPGYVGEKLWFIQEESKSVREASVKQAVKKEAFRERKQVPRRLKEV